MVKRIFDVFFSLTGLLAISWFIVLFFVIASVNANGSGLFVQQRIGRNGLKFSIYKLKTMTFGPNGQKKITAVGRFMRQTKIDELPQLYNILIGDMSVVGPRPDIEGYYDKLTGANRAILALRPGITGPASLKYKNEEAVLAQQPDPEHYNDFVIFPDKVRINLWYLNNRTLWLDLKVIIFTILNKKLNEADFLSNY